MSRMSLCSHFSNHCDTSLFSSVRDTHPPTQFTPCITHYLCRHELHILRGAQEYMEKYPVYIVFLEYYPKGLRAHGTDPMDLLVYLVDTLKYTCFDMRLKKGIGALSFREFINAYPVGNRGWGSFTDLACVRLDLI
jgi:hypothetical protein